MKQPSQSDIGYAISNTRIVLTPSRRLETFGTTVLHYHMISELLDNVNKVRIREGRIQAHKPQIITPTLSMTSNILEGFGQEAEQYVDWLREHMQDIRILQYGFVIRKQEISEEIVTDNLDAVIERVQDAVRQKDDPLAALLVGVDSPWEVCLIKMMVEITSQSVRGNIRELHRHNMFATRQESTRPDPSAIEEAFHSASRDPSQINALGKRLQQAGVFSEYEDRFFKLVKSSRQQ
jgi:hypothetical protein